MARISIISAQQASAIASPPGSGDGQTLAYLDGATDAIHLHVHEMESDTIIRLGPFSSHSAIFVWTGDIVADDRDLPAGSSLLLQAGAALDLTSRTGPVRLLCFAAHGVQSAGEAAPARIHLLPASQVPHYSDGPQGGGVRGALHADASFSPCPVWLHENHLSPPAADAPPTDADAGIHSHAEDEVIFVTSGEMRLGNRLYGPGTSLAIAADTMYGFGVGPAGLSFVNFRGGLPDAIRFKNGMTVDEVGYWRSRCASPTYVSLDPAANPS